MFDCETWHSRIPLTFYTEIFSVSAFAEQTHREEFDEEYRPWGLDEESTATP